MKWIVLLGFLLCAPSLSFSQILLNEVYYDHIGSDSGHEFVELIGTGGSPLDLSRCSLEFYDGASGSWRAVWRGSFGSIAYDELFVVGGDLVAGVDDIAALGLQNGPDGVRLLVDGRVEDVLGYGALDDNESFEGEPALDVDEGRSLSRWPDGIDSDNNAADFRAEVPTPGSYNRARYNLALRLDPASQRRAVLPPGTTEYLRVSIVNTGVEHVAATAAITVRDSTHVGLVDVDSSRIELSLPPGGDRRFEVTIAPSWGYHDIEVRADVGDERPQDDILHFQRRVGGPRVLVSEVMSYPEADCPEYVELFNDDGVAHDVSTFWFRDAVRAAAPVGGDVYELHPGAFVVLTPDSERLLSCFPFLAREHVIEVQGAWPSLNHSGSGDADSILLLDRMRLDVDRVAYPAQPSDSRGRSLERLDLYHGIRAHSWALSDAAAGGTPGQMNSRALTNPSDARRVTAEPNPFDPYAGQQLVVAVESELATAVEATVFAFDGRRIATIGSSVQVPFVFIWDGKDERGTVVAPGHYIVACTFGSGTVEKVVIACGRRR